MSTSNTLRKAASIQEKIDRLRGQLTGLLNKARGEIALNAKEDLAVSAHLNRRRKMLKVAHQKIRTGNESSRAGSALKINHRAKASAPVKTKRRSPLAGQKRAASPTGPLSPAVVKVLRSKGKAMNVREILDGLFANGYKFNSPEPKKNLAARIYRLKGVKQISAGMFGLA